MNFSIQAYDKAIEELFERVGSFQTDGKKAYKPGLDRMFMAASLMGNPQRGFKTVHVAGTNGKGSVANMLAVSLAAQGLRVGLYTSPHLLDFRERMRILEYTAATENAAETAVEGSVSTMISAEDVWNLLQDWGEMFRNLEMSFFEITTAMAFKWFETRKVDIAVIETGLGGRLDSTNIIENPELCVITNIGLDHCDLLGSSLEEIAFEKAGIIKEGADTVIGEALENVTEPIFLRKHHYTCGFSSRGGILVFAQKVTSNLSDEGEARLLKTMDLQGAYQKVNLHTAAVALDVLSKRGISRPSNDPDIICALERTAVLADFHGRWEKVCNEPLTICDIGHNSHGLKYNFRQLDVFGELILVYGSVSDKDYGESMKMIPGNSIIIFTAASTKRAVPAGQLKERFMELRPEFDSTRLYVRPDVTSAAALALDIAGTFSDPTIWVGGSSYVVSDFLKWKKKNN